MTYRIIDDISGKTLATFDRIRHAIDALAAIRAPSGAARIVRVPA
jgi:hypothetical protein